jgi:lysozyme family protein
MTKLPEGFNEAFARLMLFEGGYVNDPADPGGETKYGISKRSYPGEDIRNLTQARAQQIYLSDYWGPAGCDSIPLQAKYLVFDMAVHSGVRTAVMAVQTICGVVPDGKFGPVTAQAVQAMNGDKFAARFLGSRLDSLTKLPTWGNFGKGWARRIAAQLMEV